MGLFDKKVREISSEQSELLNKIVPQSYKRDVWEIKSFRVTIILEAIDADKRTLNKEISDVEEDRLEYLLETKSIIESNVLLFNCELNDAEPLGIIDVGDVERFGAQTSGDKWANGLIGYAIETSFDEAWAKGNAQEQAVARTKNKLLQKAKKIYPECNMIFNYSVQFRELGSSGNVFIYMCGTAAIGTNKRHLNRLKSVELERHKGLKEIDGKLNALKQKLEEFKYIHLFPKDSTIEEFNKLEKFKNEES